MKQAKTTHPIVISGLVYPMGTVVELLAVDDPLVKAEFPNMKTSKASNQIAVRFLDRKTASIGLRKSFVAI